MKTVMQLMLWYLENEGLEESGPYYKAKMLLEKEKEQINDAWDAGMSEGIGTMMADLDWDGEFINYFNETYNQNK
jgi:hypothetical protein